MTRFYLVLVAALFVVALLALVGELVADQTCIAGQILTEAGHEVFPVECTP